MADDSPTRLKGKATLGKRVAWGEPLPLDDVKAVSKVFGGSINDVLLACAAGAIDSYLRSKGDDTRGQQIRAMVPVNLRPPGDAHQLGNHFGLVPLVLPIGMANPGRAPVRGACGHDRLKGSNQPLLAMGCWPCRG